VAGGRSPSAVSRSPARRFTFRRLVCTVPVRLDTSPSRALMSHSTTGKRRARTAVIEWRPPDGRRTVYRDDRESAPSHPLWIPASAGMTFASSGGPAYPRAVGNDERKVIGCFFAKGSGTRPQSVIPAQAGIQPSTRRPAKLSPVLAPCPPPDKLHSPAINTLHIVDNRC